MMRKNVLQDEKPCCVIPRRSEAIDIVTRSQPTVVDTDTDLHLDKRKPMYDYCTWSMYFRIMDKRRSSLSQHSAVIGDESILEKENPKQLEEKLPQQRYREERKPLHSCIDLLHSSDGCTDVPQEECSQTAAENDLSLSWDSVYDEVFELEI